MSAADDVDVVRALWVAVRENDVDAIVELTTPDVEWSPTAVVAGALRGHDALREYVGGLVVAGALVDAHAYSFEARGDCVIVSGALRLGRTNGATDTVQRWWVYRVARGRIAAVASHASRDEACRDARAQHSDRHAPAA